jgi:hypothetical protein
MRSHCEPFQEALQELHSRRKSAWQPWIQTNLPGSLIPENKKVLNYAQGLQHKTHRYQLN